jgi:hypothetical protein
MLETLNYYLTFGKVDLQGQYHSCIGTIAQMAETALFSTQAPILVKNTEGAILMQLLLQTMRGTQACNEIIVPLLTRVKDRMQVQPLNAMLKKHLLGIYLSAVLYNRAAAMNYFEQQGMTCHLVQELLNLKSQMKHSYERKMFIVGLSDMLQNEVLPEELRGLLLTLISELISMMTSLTEAEERELKKAARTDLSDDDISDNSDDDLEDDESDEAVDGDNKLGFARSARIDSLRQRGRGRKKRLYCKYLT